MLNDLKYALRMLRKNPGSTAVVLMTLGLKQGIKLTLLGLVLGVLLAIGLTFGMSQLLFGVPPLDAYTYLIVAGILTGAAVFASLIPARRATQVDPLVALRYE